jgi:hypothetical protein
VLDLATIFLFAIAATGIRLIGNDDLVHQRLIEVATEDGIGRVDFGRRLTQIIEQVQFH